MEKKSDHNDNLLGDGLGKAEEGHRHDEVGCPVDRGRQRIAQTSSPERINL